jgi:hypothetical protein
MANKSTLSDYLAALGVDINNMQEFLNKLSEMLVTSSDTVKFVQKQQNGPPKTFTVASHAYLINKVETIDETFKSLLTGNANQIGVRDENGQLKRFEMQDISRVVQDLDAISDKTLARPVNFSYKTNWFFESFLNPLIYIDVPVGSLVTSPDIDKFEVRRVIMTSQAVEDTTYFDNTYKTSSVSYTALVTDLANRGITYFEDTNEVSLPPAQNRRFGSFNIISTPYDTRTEIIDGESLSITVNQYVLSTIRYNERSLTGANGVVQKTLQVGDHLLTADNSEYRITEINVSEKKIAVQRVFGIGTLGIGTNVLTIKPELVPVNTLSLNIGYNERQVIFLKPISTRLRVSTVGYSLGFGIFTNELLISLGNGERMTLADFYQQFVSDFGLLFLSFAKEKKLPSSLGVTPNAPILETSAFTVIQKNRHVRDADGVEQVMGNISSIEQIKAQIKELDQQTSEKRAELNTNAALSEAQRLKLSKDLLSLADSRKTSTTQLSSKITSVTSAIRATPALTANPVYRIKGFWHIPDARISQNGPQNVVQFKIAYRTLSKTGNSENVEQITFRDPNGNTVVGSFSPWSEVLSKQRKKIYNQQTGVSEWASENVTDPEEVNINQIELPISKGQVVEIKVKSLSEAGYPDNPIESDWSNTIQIPFPDTLQTAEDISIISQQTFAEEAKVNFQDELNSKGLDLHLGSSFTTRDKYFAHRAEDVASGFVTADGSVIDLYSKLKSVSDTLTAIQTALSSGEGELKVSIIDQSGNQKEVTNGETVTLFAGYYKDQIKNAAGQTTQYEHGKIITKQYYIQLENVSQTPLELISLISGGLLERATTSSFNETSVYNTSLRYDVSPIVINEPTDGIVGGHRQADGLQSSQVKGQVIYTRAKSVNLSEPLYVAEPSEVLDGEVEDPFTNYPIQQGAYNYQTLYSANSNVNGGANIYSIPYISGHYVPVDPTLSSLQIRINGSSYPLTANVNVWKGRLSASNAPIGGGLLSEFCISIDHPDLKKNGRYNKAWSPSLYLPLPVNNSTGLGISDPARGYSISPFIIKRLPFSHAAHFETSQSDIINALGARNFQQAAYRKPELPDVYPPTLDAMRENHYPIKSSFETNDKYLIGRYTCGAYMFISPKSYQEIGATSISPNAVKRIVQVGVNNSIKIPLVFQYRCSDYLKYVGGFRADQPSGLTNVGYVKKMGFDIGLKSQVFSFDVEIGARYTNDTALVTPNTGVTQTAQLLS